MHNFDFNYITRARMERTSNTSCPCHAVMRKSVLAGYLARRLSYRGRLLSVGCAFFDELTTHAGAFRSRQCIDSSSSSSHRSNDSSSKSSSNSNKRFAITTEAYFQSNVNNIFDMILIDGNSSESSLRTDLQLAMNHISTHGTIAVYNSAQTLSGKTQRPLCANTLKAILETITVEVDCAFGDFDR